MIKGNLKTGGSFAGWGVKTGKPTIIPVVRSIRADIPQPSSLDVSEVSSPLSDGSLSQKLLAEHQQKLTRCSRHEFLYESSRDMSPKFRKSKRPKRRQRLPDTGHRLHRCSLEGVDTAVLKVSRGCPSSCSIMYLAPASWSASNTLGPKSSVIRRHA